MNNKLSSYSSFVYFFTSRKNLRWDVIIKYRLPIIEENDQYAFLHLENFLFFVLFLYFYSRQSIIVICQLEDIMSMIDGASIDVHNIKAELNYVN